MLQFGKDEEASVPYSDGEPNPGELQGCTGKEKPSAEREIKLFAFVFQRWKRALAALVAVFAGFLKLQLLREVTNKHFLFSATEKKTPAFLPVTAPPSSTLI